MLSVLFLLTFALVYCFVLALLIARLTAPAERTDADASERPAATAGRAWIRRLPTAGGRGRRAA